MDKALYDYCISHIIKNSEPGFSFVKEFVGILVKNKNLLQINNIVTYWYVNQGYDGIREYFYYSENLKFNLGFLNLPRLSMEKHWISSDDSEFYQFVMDSQFTTKHILAIPINHHEQDDGLLAARGVVLLFSQIGKINILPEQVHSFHLILNCKSPNIYTNDSVVKAFKELSYYPNDHELSFMQGYADIGKSLDTIASKHKGTDKDFPGLRHFSFWQIREDAKGQKLFTKEFSRNTYNSNSRIDTHKNLRATDYHYLFECTQDNNVYIQSQTSSVVKYLSFTEAERSFKDKDYFVKIGLTNENSTIIVVTIKNDINTDYPSNICCYYIRDIIYSVFICQQLTADYTHELVRRIGEESLYCQNTIVSQMMLASLQLSEEEKFYRESAKILCKANEASDCLIYTINELGEVLLKSKKVPDGTISGWVMDNNGKRFYIPDAYSYDKPFLDWLSTIKIVEDLPSTYSEINDYYENEKSECVKSAMVIRKTLNSDTGRCVIILINQIHKPSSSCVYFHNVFLTDNYQVTHPSGAFLLQYQQLQDSIKKKHYLLSKLRHEIPNCSKAIRTGILKIQNSVREPDFVINNVLTIANNVLLNNNRIYLWAAFFSASDFTFEQFTKDADEINIKTFLNSYIETFREEGLYKGVDVYFSLEEESISVYGSNFYQLAIVNIVINAIRYAAEGTRVSIQVFSDRIEVTDIGIAIREDEKNKIFNEGFRGREARTIDGKGMGFGLYLTKKVLDAHHYAIEVNSEKVASENIYSMAAILRYLDSLNDPKKVKEFIYKDLRDSQYNYAMELYKEIRNHKYIEDRTLINYETDVIRFWLDYLTSKHAVFVDMPKRIFNREIHKVKFTIYF